MTPPQPNKRPCGRLIYAASESDADLLYASRFLAPDPFLWYNVAGEEGILVSSLEVGRAVKEAARGVTVRSFVDAREAWGVPSRARKLEAYIEALGRHHGVSRWEVPGSFPLGLARRLSQRRIRLTPVSDFFPQRRSKSPEEVEHLREGVALAETGMNRAFDILREASITPEGELSWNGAALTADTLRGEVDAEIARKGGTASHTIAAPGEQGADPHATGTGIIRANTPIVLDIFPRVDATGYFGDLTRTIVKGEVPPIVEKAYTAVHDAQVAAMAAIRAGASASAPHTEAAQVLALAGFETDADTTPPHGFFHGTGHGLGLEIHESPRLSGKAKDCLESGDVVTVEPGLYYPEWGGVRLEDVVVVTDEGCENLTTIEKALRI
ncbi:MAG: aminopeptidase P family protein, partial [Lentisphaerae bacterium]|nr:aminopeptidase P family protein [Lentisphaerota bacterium]